MRRLRTMSAVKFGRRPVCRRVGSAPNVSSHNRNHSGCSPVMNVRILRETRHGKNIAIIAAYSSMATMYVKKTLLPNAQIEFREGGAELGSWATEALAFALRERGGGYGSKVWGMGEPVVRLLEAQPRLFWLVRERFASGVEKPCTRVTPPINGQDNLTE